MDEDILLKIASDVKSFKNANNGKKLTETQEVILRLIARDIQRTLDQSK